MFQTIKINFALLLALSAFSAASASADLKPVKQEMIRASIAAYPGNCPCPYNRASNGSSCGRRSAYNRPGGAAPLCFEEDISDEAARSYLNSKGR